MDAFYASIEQRDDPRLRGRPVLVGGTGNRGVVAAASYEARRFGIRSAMPSARARSLCPHAVFLRPRMAHYQRESRRIFEIFHRFTPLVESLSLDEAFLDVSESRRLLGDGETIARQIKAAVLEEVGLVASVGVAPNKFLAKLASDQDKPDGLFVVSADHIQAFLDPLPVRRIWGIGRRAEERLETVGVRTVRQLRQSDPGRLRKVLGNQVEHFLALSRGEDVREVVPERPEKSISNEVTLDRDATTEEQCRRILLELSGRVGERLRRRGIGGKTVSVKIRTAAFRTYTRSHTLSHSLNDDRGLYREVCTLFQQWWRESGPARIRLLGVGTSKLEGRAEGDDLVPTADERGRDRVADAIRERYGGDALRPASLLGGRRKPD